MIFYLKCFSGKSLYLGHIKIVDITHTYGYAYVSVKAFYLCRYCIAFGKRKRVEVFFNIGNGPDIFTICNDILYLPLGNRALYQLVSGICAFKCFLCCILPRGVVKIGSFPTVNCDCRVKLRINSVGTLVASLRRLFKAGIFLDLPACITYKASSTIF